MIARIPPQAEERMEPVPVLFSGGVWETIFEGNVRTLVERDALGPFLRRQRWFGGKGRVIRAARFDDWSLVRTGAQPAFLTTVLVEYTEGLPERYLVPLMAVAEPAATRLATTAPTVVLAWLTGARKGAIVDALIDDEFCLLLIDAVAGRLELTTRRGVARGFLTSGFDTSSVSAAPGRVRRGEGEQSNTSIRFDDRYFFKLFRRIERGPNPDLEIGRYLTERAGFPRVPKTVGGLELHERDGSVAALALLQTLAPSQANGWDHAIDELKRYYERAESQTAVRPPVPPAGGSLAGIDVDPPPIAIEVIGAYRESAATLGRRTAELHLALGHTTDDPAFTPEPLDSHDLSALASTMMANASDTFALLEANLDRIAPDTLDLARVLLDRRERVAARFRALTRPQASMGRIRVHGDYHLGQVLWAEGDIVILDFEGEPARSLAARRAKQSPLKDVAGMLRSFSYAAYAALLAYAMDRPAVRESLAPWAELWQAWTSAAFLRSYLAAAGPASFLPLDRSSLDALLGAFMLDKALYELRYELNNRSQWVRIPLWGIASLLPA